MFTSSFNAEFAQPHYGTFVYTLLLPILNSNVSYHRFLVSQ